MDGRGFWRNTWVLFHKLANLSQVLHLSISIFDSHEEAHPFYSYLGKNQFYDVDGSRDDRLQLANSTLEDM